MAGESAKRAATLQEAWRAGVDRLRSAGVEEAGPDAELLLMHALGKSKSDLLRDWREPWPQAPGLQSAWEGMLARRAAGEPVQYVIGEQYFYGRRFAVNPDVLIPRPETELLVEAILAAADRIWPVGDGAGAVGGAAIPHARHTGTGTVPHVLDVGTGSGAIAVTIALERPAWRVTASDLSPAALAVARHNAGNLGASERLRFVQGDLLEPFVKAAGSAVHAGIAMPDAAGPVLTDRGVPDAAFSDHCVPDTASAGLSTADHASADPRTLDAVSPSAAAAYVPADVPPIDILVSNPPYIPSVDMPGLQREVRDYEPRLALDGGGDGLAPYRRMAEQLRLLPAMPRIVGWEVGAGQAEDVADLLRSAAVWTEIRFVTDYAGIHRHVLAY